MQNNPLFSATSSVYPGEYVSLYKESDFSKSVKYSSKNKTSGRVNINESDNTYKIELAIPGVERENLFLKAWGNVLSVAVIYNSSGKPLKQKKFRLHESAFDGSFCHKIILPDNADPVFISAKYRSGILQLHISKSNHPVKRVNTNIAVY